MKMELNNSHDGTVNKKISRRKAVDFMKVFVLKRGSIFMYLLMLAAVFGIYRVGVH